MTEPPLTLADPERARADAERLFDVVSISLAAVLPRSADIRHIGATAVPGCLTKGDLDVVVRVPAADFDAADALLASRFARNEGSVRTDAFSAFEDAGCHPHLGIQLVAVDGPLDEFHRFVEALLKSSALVDEYNTLKRRYVGVEMETYRAAKGAFVEKVLATLAARRSPDRKRKDKQMDYKPHGYTSAAPYLIVDGAKATMDFLVQAFDAEPLRQIPGEGGRLRHAEARIGDTVVMLADPAEGWPAVPAHVHVYVPDVDATYARAVAAGAESVQVPAQKDDPDKRGGVRDAGGTTWWIATQLGASP
ncbi:MAG: GrpB family protein [Hyphomicrobiaceae bacterium]